MYNGLTQLLVWLLVVLVSLPWPVRLAAQGTGTVFQPEEIEQLVAPIALYPDSLVSQILMASTYPLEVVEAARWAKGNKTLKGDALTAALEKQTWEPSVKSLVNFPQVLDMMNEKLDLTQRLGDAFLAQQKDVLDAIQRLRLAAQPLGTLKTTKEQTVIVEQPAAQTTVIKIEPTNPQVVYVPTYNPTVVYGAWPYPTYPPYTHYPPGYAAATAAFSFTAGVALGAAWGYAWEGMQLARWGCRYRHQPQRQFEPEYQPSKVPGGFSSARATCARRVAARREASAGRRVSRSRDGAAVQQRHQCASRAGT